ncbi:MAG: aryl-sulfate sulfotransferase [Bacteroidota bacterium]
MKKLFFICLLIFPALICAQDQTVGLFSVSPDSYEGYTLFAPIRTTTTYLIDHCGNLVHEWESDYTPGNSAYLLENGHLLKASRVPELPVVNAGGYGGIIQILDWDSNVLWEYWYNSDSTMQHHDVAYMPNGNVLILAWETKTMEEAIQAGRNPSVVTPIGIYPVHIVEVEPVGQDSGTIVWKWHIWDHLVQEYDPTKDNYGIVADHPELLDINYHPGNSGADWLHCNSIEYNPVLDQIVISSRFNDEFYVIDHSTTTEEAAGHTGGNSGKGGDILYRWGNPEVYDRGDEDDRMLFKQHDASWIPEGLENGGKFMVFNNGFGQVGPDFSTVEVVDPPVDNDGNYIIIGQEPFGPTESLTTFIAPNPSDFYTPYMGNAQVLPNGNILLCESSDGRFVEVDSQGNTVWEYVNPASGGGIVTQGNPIPSGPGQDNSVFRCYRYSPDFPGLTGKDLTPGLPIEINPEDIDCPVTTSVMEPDEKYFIVYPNPAINWLIVEFPKEISGQLKIFDAPGRKVFESQIQFSRKVEIDISPLDNGVYFLSVQGLSMQKVVILR